MRFQNSEMMLEMKFKQNHEIKSKSLEYIVNKKYLCIKSE